MLKYAAAAGQARTLLKSLNDGQTKNLQNAIRGFVSTNVIDGDKQPLLSSLIGVVLQPGKMSENVDTWVVSSEAMQAIDAQKKLKGGVEDLETFLCPHCNTPTDLSAISG